MSTPLDLFLFEDLQTVKTLMERFEKKALEWEEAGFVEYAVSPDFGPDRFNEDDKEKLLYFLNVSKELESPEKYAELERDLHSKLEKFVSTMTFVLRSEYSSQYAYLLFKLFPDAYVIEGDFLMKAKECAIGMRDLNPKEYARILEHDSEEEQLKDPLEQKATLIPVSDPLQGEIISLIEELRQNTENMERFSDFLDQATNTEKKLLEQILRNQVIKDNKTALEGLKAKLAAMLRE